MDNFGFPSRTYFELFTGKHPSDKIYSVQVKDWIDAFSKPVWDNLHHDVNAKPDRFVYEDRAAVVEVGNQSLENKLQHLLVEPTADLVNFLANRGITIPDRFYVQPLAFNWPSDEEFVVEDDVEVENNTTPDVSASKNNNKNNNKALLAAIIAAISLLS